MESNPLYTDLRFRKLILAPRETVKDFLISESKSIDKEACIAIKERFSKEYNIEFVSFDPKKLNFKTATSYLVWKGNDLVTTEVGVSTIKQQLE